MKLASISTVIAVLAAACGKSGGGGGAPATKDYELRDRIDPAAAMVPVRVAVPEGWVEEVDKMGGPTFKPGGNGYSMIPHVAVLLVNCPGDSKGPECIDKRIALEVGDEGPVERRQRGAATWMLLRNTKNGGAMESRYVFDAPSGELVKCFVIEGKDDDVAALHAICDSIVIRP